MYRVILLLFPGRPRERVGRFRRQVFGDSWAGQLTASGTTSGPVPRDDAHVVGAPEHVSGRILVDGSGKVVLAQMDKKGSVRSVGNDELQLAARHVVHAFVRQSTQPAAVALLVSLIRYT